jgi:RNA polymerase sigma-70 factor (ECF subfamily)
MGTTGGVVSTAVSWAGRRSVTSPPRGQGASAVGGSRLPSVPRTVAVTGDPSAPMERMGPSESLRDLAALARRDGGEAAETLLGRVRQLALRYARSRLGRFGAEDVAQDVAQEVCMAVHTGLRTYDDRGLPFEAFVYAIAARKTADAQRLLIRGPQAVAEIPDVVDLTAGPEDAALLRDEAARAAALMRTLPQQQQEILTLRVAVGMSTEETAAALGMTTGAIRVAQHRALTRLRALLAEAQEVAS